MSVQQQFRITGIHTSETDPSIEHADNLQVSVTLRFCYMKIRKFLLPPHSTETHPFVSRRIDIPHTHKLIPFTLVFKISPHNCEMLTLDTSNATSPILDLPMEFRRILCLRGDQVFDHIRNAVSQQKPKQIRVLLEARIVVEIDIGAVVTATVMLATLKNTEFDGEAEDSECCSICLVEFLKGERVKLTPCSHRFHKKCLYNWFSTQRLITCPLCRFQMEMPNVRTSMTSNIDQ